MPKRRPLARFVFLFSLLMLPAILFARAGGGGSYSGGHSSGGGGSHGGGGSGGDGGAIVWLLWQLLRLCIYHPFIGIPIVVAIIAFFYIAGSKGKETYQSSVIRRGNALVEDQQRMGVLNSIYAADPAFSETALQGRIRVAFEKIQLAWSAQDLTPVRPFISDGVHERFSLQFEEQKSLGIRNQMSDVTISNIYVAGGFADDLFDVLSFSISASATDTVVRLADGKRVSGSTSPQPFTEIWTFIRRRGAKTDPNKPGLIEGNCPNCGGLIEMNQNAACKYCGAVLRSGEYDWVLSEITQECEWQPHADRDIPGVEAMRGKDSGFNLQALEDRASVVFWRVNAAIRQGNTKPLSKAALPQFIEECQQNLRTLRDDKGTRTWYGDTGVGSVDTLGIVFAREGEAPSEPSFDHALLEVKWSATRFTTDGQGQHHRHEATSVAHTLLVLSRKADSKTDLAKTIDSAHCPTCGAPETNTASGACEFCGATLNDGSKQWALAHQYSLSSQEARQWLARLNDVASHESRVTEQLSTQDSALSTPPPIRRTAPPPPSTILAWMVKMTLADGQLDAAEREMLTGVATRYKVPLDRLEQLIAAAQTNSLDLPAPANDDEARAHLRAMARAALADGKITRSEYTLLQNTGQRLGLAEADIQLLLKKTRSDLYQESRAALKNRNGK